MKNFFSGWVPRQLGTLGLLLATAGAAQAQTATFAPVAAYSTGASSNPADVKVADVNGDGRLDLLTANYGSSTAGVLLGNGNGTFQAAATYSTGSGSNPFGIAVADVNADGRLDLLTANSTTNTAGVLLGNGNGTFQAVAAYSTGSDSNPYHVVVADVNGDGRPDLITANYGTSTAGLLLGNGNGTFQTVIAYPTGTNGNPYDLAVADVNGDGRPDLLTTNAATNTAGVLLGNGNGTFQAVATYSTGSGSTPFGIAVADVNADSRPDLLTANYTGAGVLLGNGNGTFQTAVTYLASTSTTSNTFDIAAADVNGDGRPDLLTANVNTSTAGVLLGNGNGTFQTVVAYSTGTNSTPYGIAVADVNGDGRPDLLTANYSASAVGVLLNTTVYATPTLTQLSPTSGLVGASITLTGTNLSSATAVSFNGTAAAFTVVNATTITATVPTGATSGNVTVTTPGGTSNGVQFTVTLPVTAAPVLTTPANNSTTNGLPTFVGTAPAGSTITLYLAMGSGAAQAIGTTTATGGSFSFVPASALASGSYSAYATAQLSGQAVSANSNTNTFTVDATPPTATLSTTASSPTNTSPIPFTVSFSEPVTGFSVSSLNVSNGTVTAGSLSGSGSTYTFSVTPTGNGTVSVSVAANAVRDAVGNGNPASTAISVQYTAPVAAGLSVLYQTGDLGQPTDGQVRPFLQLVNTGTTAVPYSSLTVRYWLTVENFLGQLVTPIDYAKLGTSLVSARYVALASPRQGAFGYIEYSFAAGAGSLNPGTDSGPIYGKAYKPDYSNLDETDDWSYQTSSSFTTNAHVTLYQNGTLISGTEPPAVTATTALQVYTASRDASASTSYVSVQLQVRNTGNVPLNYSDLKARYYFTRDGASTIVPQVDYAKLGNNNISLRVVNLAAPVNGADAYLEITFSSALGVFYPRTSTDDILFKLRKEDYSAFDQTNDYSFSGATTLALNTRFTALVNNTLVFGTPPVGAPARMAATPAPASASVGGATIVAAASGPLALTASPNPFAEQLHLRFALPTTQAYSLAVYDGQGRLVQQLASGQAEADQAQEVEVPTQTYAAGFYLVRLTTATGVQTLKLVKQ